MKVNGEVKSFIKVRRDLDVWNVWMIFLSFLASGIVNMLSEIDIDKKARQESNLSTEIGIVVLDMIELFCGHFKVNLEGLLKP